MSKNTNFVILATIWLIVCASAYYILTKETKVIEPIKDITPMIKNKGALEPSFDDRFSDIFVIQSGKYYKISSNDTISIKKEITVREYNAKK